MRRFSCLGLALVLAWGWSPGVSAQTPAPSPEPTAIPGPSPEPNPESTPPPDPDHRVLELQTAGYYELVDRARELGLPVTGSVTDLRDRLAKAWGVTLPPGPKATGRTLTIDSAREAGLIDVEAPGDGKLLRLSGGLSITLVDHDKNVTHIIEAGELWYDQAAEEMTARGQVVYTIQRASTKEVFRGESLTFRLSDSQGVFYGGASDRSRSVGDQTLVFRYQGDAIRRSNGDMVVLETGSITSSLGTDPYYHIQAKKIWVLAPGEWGLQDAVLYLGRIPVLYFPFFFQPGDDFFFNPVLSFPDAGDRRGTSLQTTTYIFGKKKRDSAPLSFLQLEDSTEKSQEKVLKGLFLVKGTPPATTVPDTWTLKVLADFYSNLGFLTALDGNLPGVAGLKTLTFQAGVGVTRTVNSSGLTFSINPFQAALDPWDQSVWNGSWLGSWRLPVRWGGSWSLAADWGAASLEYFSDPILYNDLFGSRSENFSVFSLLGMGPAKKTVTATSKSSLNWTGNVNVAPLAASASLLWESKTINSSDSSGNPENQFYYPSQLTFPQVTLDWSGTLWPLSLSTSTPSTKPPEPSRLIPPGTTETVPETTPVESSSIAETSVVPPTNFESLVPSSSGPTWQTNATWSLRPSAKTYTQFDNTKLKTPQDPSWTPLLSRWTASYDARVAWNTGWSDGSWTANQAFNLQQTTQETWYLGPSVSSSDTTTYQAQDKQSRTGLLNQTLNSAWKPWVAGGAWRESNVQYSLSTKLWEARADSTKTFDGTKDMVTSHQASAQAVWYLTEGTPTIKTTGGWQTTLVPLETLRTWSGALDVSVPGASASSRVSARQTDRQWTWDPWDSTAEWKPVSDLSLRETFQYDLENARPLVSTTSLTAWGASVQYRHQRTTPYRFDTSTVRWVTAGDLDFLPQELRLTYSFNLPSYQWWFSRNTLSSKIDLSWPINLQKYSEMPLTLNYTINYKLHRFLDFQVTEGIINRTTYQYFPSMVDSFGKLPNGENRVKWKNPLLDLWQALSVWDWANPDASKNSLRLTNFKMTNLTFGLVHYLDDWVLKLDYTGAPQLNTAGTQYDWKGTLTLLVQWYPVPELKTQVQVDKEGVLSVLKNTN